jgi:hypothetical protein
MASSGCLGKRSGEVQHLSDNVSSVGGLGDTHGEVIVTCGPRIPVVCIARRVRAGRRLEVDPTHRTPTNRQDDFGRGSAGLVSGWVADHASDYYGVNTLEAHCFGRGARKRRCGTFRSMFVNVADYQSGWREHQDGDVSTQLVTIECGLVVNDVTAGLLAT